MDSLQSVLDFLSSDNLARLASDPRAVVVAAFVFVVAVWFRMKIVLLFLFAVGAMMAVLRYTRMADEGGGSIDPSTFLFAGGTLAVAVVLIYYLFIKE
jgi:preprotein translocase subunit Sec61beta